MACFIVDDIKHFNVKCSVVFISFLLLLLCPYPHEERQSRGDPGSVPSQNKSGYGMLVVSAQPPFVSLWLLGNKTWAQSLGSPALPAAVLKCALNGTF